ncbi:prepilin peptidase [Rathayibacter sp. SD072]|uniref:prepilin peptidase n=1 Tax=Rathayibacter sp. SD072 TaxID=2781731 RepID=UPI001A95EE82|nr:prepilin peptidase [Rathayibacter sp. SD072]MBO0983954.1 prepilin peptidase [Rathayibacter sp. SD072]
MLSATLSLRDLVATALGATALIAVAVTSPLPVGSLAVAMLIAAVSVPLVLGDVREHRLPNALTLPLLAAGAASVVGDVLSGRGDRPVLAALMASVVLGVLHLAGGLGMGDLKLGSALALPLSTLSPEAALTGLLLPFLLAGTWTLPFLLRGDSSRIPFGPFQLTAFWLVLALH